MVGSKLLITQVFTPSSNLRVMALGGEPFPRKTTFERWVEHAPSTLRVFNIYGITEVSAWASIYEIGNIHNALCRPPPTIHNNTHIGGCQEETEVNNILRNPPTFNNFNNSYHNEVSKVHNALAPTLINNKVTEGGVYWHDWIPIGRPLSKTSLHVWKMATCFNEEETNRGELGRLVIGKNIHIFRFFKCLLFSSFKTINYHFLNCLCLSESLYRTDTLECFL